MSCPAPCGCPMLGPMYLKGENVVSIHPFLPVLCLVSAIITLGFCLGLVAQPFAANYQGSLTYISQGMDFYCGWSGAVLGSCALFIGLCELVVALHTSSSGLLVAVLIQAPAWSILIGVSGTGWAIHYVSLLLFMGSTFYYHWILASCHPSAGTFYFKTNCLATLNLFFFLLAFLVAHVVSGAQSTKLWVDITVSLEITLMCCISVQNLCVAGVLYRYKNIHLLFEDEDPPGTFML